MVRSAMIEMGGLWASSGLIALAVVSITSSRSELAAVYPPYASRFAAPKAAMQGLRWSDRNTLKDQSRQRAQYWDQQNQGIAEGLLDPMDAARRMPRRMQALHGAQGNWNLDLTSPRLQSAEESKYNQQQIARYNQGEENVQWDPTTWHNVVGARGVRSQGLRSMKGSMLSQANEPWNLDGSSGRLQEAEKKKYYQLRKERYERGETSHGKYPSDEQWIMPSARGVRTQGLYQQPFAEGWNVDSESPRLARAEKKAYYKNEAQRYFRGESDGPSPFNGE